ncbi:MAG: protein TolQ [Methylothermaceae bacteria B42]|nr:MAG: protein TolQ [Methylothermaceae bacteria B42]HHJ39007.1 protein TolQ [Methylothermaceae bacterium]
MTDSLFGLIANASLLVQLVMAILLLASLASWTLIFQKHRELKQVEEEAENFESRFWSGIDLAELYKQLNKSDAAGLETVFLAGYKESAKLFKLRAPPHLIAENVERAMRVAISRVIEDLDDRLPFLATVGSTSPYVGLFGTVWGIMNSFRALGDVQQATLALVAPGIAEALIATAMGLFAAIPAVIAYNRFSTHIDRIQRRYDNFAEEFICLLQRKAIEL